MSDAAEPVAANDSGEDSPVAAKTPVIPVPLSELVAVVVFAVAADLLVFRGEGYSATAVFCLVFVGLLLTLAFLRGRSTCEDCIDLSRSRVPIGILLVIMSIVIARLVWLGSVWTVASAFIVSTGLAMSCSGRCLDVLQGLLTLLLSPVLGIERLKAATIRGESAGTPKSRFRWVAWLVPSAVTAIFGCVFVFANPEIFTSVTRWLNRIGDRLSAFFQGVSIWEFPFCLCAAVFGAGLLRPLATKVLPDAFREILPTQGTTKLDGETESQASGELWYAVSRNTLVAVIAAFAAYLPFEFMTLWRREFPEGFYYAGYAHQGAAWLTVALLLATVVLSVIFHARTSAAVGTERLRRLAWVWSGLNGVLAIAVYNRLMIYVGYNGMTQMRTVGFFGITLVVVGFGLVVWKIKHQKTFAWLIRAQLLAFAGALVAFTVFPVDYVAHRYNAAKVLGGDPKPSVMIAVKQINDEGCLPLCDLVDVEDPIIRDGVRAILARRVQEIRLRPVRAEASWHEYQGATSRLMQRLGLMTEKWLEYEQDSMKSESAVNVFRDYAMKWY